MIEGPYCFVYFNRKQKRLWLSRDPLGRHSLLWQIEHESLLITSVGCKDVSNLNEIPAIGLFCFLLDGDTLTGILELINIMTSYIRSLSFVSHSRLCLKNSVHVWLSF